MTVMDLAKVLVTNGPVSVIESHGGRCIEPIGYLEHFDLSKWPESRGHSYLTDTISNITFSVTEEQQLLTTIIY